MSDQILLKYIDEPLLTSSSTVKKFGEEPWRQLKYPQALLVVGDKRSGKDVVLDNELLILYKKYFTCIRIFDGGGHEPLYYAIRKDCKRKWGMVDQVLDVFYKNKTNVVEISKVHEQTSIDSDLIPRILKVMEGHKMIKLGTMEIGLLKDGKLQRKGAFLHCECDESFPITVQTPPWIKWKQKQVDQFNGLYWDGFWEYNEAHQKGLVHEYLSPDTNFQEIKKPKEMIKEINPMIEFVQNIDPVDKKKLEQFQETWRDIVLDARQRHRVVIGVNTSFYPDTEEGKLAKYHTFGEIVNYQRTLADKYFIPLKKQETTRQKNWHKMGLFASELWKPVPDSAISPEKESAFSKRAFLALMPTVRHAKTWIRVNSQSMGDVLKKSNKQQDLKIIKRSSEENLGEQLSWFSTKIEKNITKWLVKHRFWKIEGGKLIQTPLTKPLKNILLNRGNIISIADLPDNRGYVVNGNGDYIMEKWNLPRNHHKSDAENFTGDTGIEFIEDKKYFVENPTKTKTTSETQKKTRIIREKVLSEAHEINERKGKKFPKIYDELIEKYNGETDEGKYLRSVKRSSFVEIHRQNYKKP